MARTTVSYHLTKSGAEGKRFDLQQTGRKGRSSGWSRIDYGVERTGRLFSLKRWRVYARSQ